MSLIQPHFTYDNFLMNGITQKLKRALQVQQNAALRAVKNVELGCPTNMIFAELGLDRLKTLADKAAVKLVFKGINGISTPYLNNAFKEYMPNRPLRSVENLNVEIIKIKTKFGESNFIYTGGKLWNSLPESVKSAVS